MGISLPVSKLVANENRVFFEKKPAEICSKQGARNDPTLCAFSTTGRTDENDGFVFVGTGTNHRKD